MTDTNDNFGDLDRHASFLRRIAWKSVRGEDLDDLVQDCLLVELEHGPQDERRTFAWLRTIMRNRVAEDYRRRARRSLREKASAKSELTSSAFEVVEHRAALKAVTNAVTGLPPELYDVIRLRYFDGLKIKEIALKRKLPQRTVKYRLELALGQLRRKLENKGNGRGALATLAGFANDRAWNIGAWLAVKKMTLGVVIAVLAIGTLSWVVWTDASLGVDVLDEPASQVIARDAQIARRADTVLEDSDGEAKPEVTALAIDRQRDIFGRVVTQLNEPIEGAAVESRSHPWQRLSVLSPRASEYVVGGRTQSGIDGSFALRHQRGDVVEIRVSKPGFASLSLTRRVAGEKLKIVLHPAGALRIEVLAEGGCPIHEARVTIWREATKGSGGSQYDRRHYTSDARGEILIEDLAPGRIKFHVRHRAYLGSPFKDTQIDAGTRRDLTVTLGAAGVIRGRVTDAQTGAALAGAKVSIQSGGDPAITDADGYYERPGCSTAKGSQILIEVSAKGFASDQKLASFGQRTYDFALNRGDAVVGRCLDLEGRAIGGVRVSLVASARSVNGQVTDMASALSQSDGSFRIEDLRRSLPHTLIFDSPGYGRKHLDFDPFPGDRPGVIDLGDVALAAGLKIAGRIIRDDGTLVANTRVTLKGTNADRFKYRGVGAGVAVRYYGESEQRRSDDLGRFCFPDLSTGEFTLEVSLRGSVLSKIAVNLSTEDREDIEFVAVPGEVMTLKATGGHGSKFRDLRPLEIAADLEFQAIILDATTPISGRVVDVAGKSLAGVEVGAQLANGELRQVFS
ncbi:MAG: sigma-70 family RNA polymerase sigma factor, partial [Planctomycetota bacterium]